MIEIIKELLNVLHEYNLNMDDIPLDHDWGKNPIALFYLMDTASEEEGTNDYDLQIHITAHKKDKLQLLRVVEEVGKILKRKNMDSGWIIPKNAYLNHYMEDDKHCYILEFWVKTYNSN